MMSKLLSSRARAEAIAVEAGGRALLPPRQAMLVDTHHRIKPGSERGVAAEAS